MSFAKVLVFGNLTKDPEQRFTPAGQEVASFTVAVNDQWKDAAGEKKEKVSFLQCTAFGKAAEIVTKYFHKGDPIIVDGKIEEERWQDKETGANRSRVKILVNKVEFIGGKRSAGDTAGAATAGTPAVDDDGEIPF